MGSRTPWMSWRCCRGFTPREGRRSLSWNTTMIGLECSVALLRNPSCAPLANTLLYSTGG